MKPTPDIIQLITLPTHKDNRGNFIKIFNSTNKSLANFSVSQINYVANENRTLRGLHYQTGEFAESKFFRVLNGSIQLICFCIDDNNQDYGKSFSNILNTPNSGLLIPKGYATGYLVLSNNTNVLYLSDNEYNLKSEKGIRWDDPILNIEWDTKNPNVSEKDINWPSYKFND